MFFLTARSGRTFDHLTQQIRFFCFLYGRTIPFTTARVVELYPSKVDFTQKWSDAVDVSVAAGFLLEVDGDDLKAAAEAWDYPN